MGGASVPDDLLAQLHPLEIKVLPHLTAKTLSELAAKAKMQEVEVMRALQWLENKKALTMEVVATHELSAGRNALDALKNGLPEERLLAVLPKTGATPDAVAKKAGLNPQEIGASIGVLKRKGLVDFGKNKELIPKGTIDTKKTHALLQKLQKGCLLDSLSKEEQELLKEFQSRKEYVETKERRDRKIILTDLGKELMRVDVKKISFSEKLTKEDLESGNWKKKKYRAYDVSVPVPFVQSGKKHFVQEAIEYCRRIWLEMGFQEMTGSMVQSAFWDLDALFVPQDHPAREMQDTFYLGAPASTNTIDRQAYHRVQEVHETGANTGSTGWKTPFKREVAETMLMRTHTTVLSARTLWAIREGKLPMGKYFSIGKCFRNEKVDWKHAFEFNQVEGIVVDKNVTFAHLLSYLKTFFAKMGFPDVRLRPSHFPYTEPSVEIDVWHPGKKQWLELGGAGMFRPEVTKTLLGEEIPVLAWGPGFDRIIMDYFALQDIRDLYRNDIKQLQDMKRFFKTTEAYHG